MENDDLMAEMMNDKNIVDPLQEATKELVGEEAGEGAEVPKEEGQVGEGEKE